MAFPLPNRPTDTPSATASDFPWQTARGSRRSRTVNRSIRWTVPALSSGFGMRSADTVNAPSPAMIRAARPLVNQSVVRLSPVPRGTSVTQVRERHGVRGEWVHGRGVTPGGTIIYYLHGSGFVVCSPRTHRGLVSRFSTLTGMPAFSLDYRLGPEHQFPSAGDDAIAGYRWLLDRGYSPERIVVAGDSAGGHMALDLIAHNHAHGLGQPRAMVLFSPLSDPTFGISLARQQGGHIDPMIDARLGAHVIRMYLGDVADDHPRVQIALTPDMELPPTLVQAGSLEVMADDARDIHRRVTAAGGASELQIWPDQTHVFQMFPLFAPESARALRAAASFVAAQFDPAHANAAG